MAKVASLKVEIQGDSTALSNSLKKASDKMQAFGDKATSIGQTLSTRLTLPIVAFGAMAVKAASDSEETFSKFATIFRDVEHNADVAFKSLRDNYGLSSKASKQLLSDTGDLLTGFGFSQQSALELSTEVNKLAVDLASFTNFSGGAEGASQALTKALLGERDSIKSLGISIMEEDVQKRVAINTTKGLTFETDRQAKAFATLQLAQEQSKNAIGDYERTQGGFANQFKLLGQRTNDLAVEFGTVLLPALTRMVGFMTKVTESLSKMDSGTKNFVITLVAFAAGIGPVIYGVGLLTTGINSLTIAMVKNPYTALAIGILAIGTAAYVALNGISELDSELTKKAGITTLTGTEDERNRLIKLRDEIKANKDATKALIKAGVTLQEGSYLIGQIALYREQIVQIDETIRKSNDLSIQKQELAKSAKEASDRANDLQKALGGTTTEVVHQAGSTDALNAKLEELQVELGATGSSIRRAQLAHQIRGITSEIERLEKLTEPMEEIAIGIQKLITASTVRGQLPLAQLPQHIIEMNLALRETPLLIEMLDFSLNLAKDSMMDFTNLAIQGFADLVVSGGKVIDMLENIGKMVLSGAIQLLLRYGLFGAVGLGSTAIGASRGLSGLIGDLFKGSKSMGNMGSVTPASASLTLDGQFQIRGTDLVYVMNRAERSLR